MLKTNDPSVDKALAQAAEWIRQADAIWIGAGAGMGVDSGLPDFRGNEGFWKAYPPFRGKPFSKMSNPTWFFQDPELAWGFFGHRHNLYTTKTPHKGFSLLLKWGQAKPAGYFVFTSNVDGQFQKAGFPEERVNECHGSIHYLQCVRLCHGEIWPAGALNLKIDPSSFRTRSRLPQCPQCGGLARPNILMFGDGDWLDDRQAEQHRRYQNWLDTLAGKRLVAIEMGAGSAIPTVRQECESIAPNHIRINPVDYAVGPGGVGIPLGANEALTRIDRLLFEGK